MGSEHDMLWWLTDIWPKVLAFDAGRYLIAASVMFAVTYLVLRRYRPSRRLQRGAPQAADYRREFLTSLRTVLIFSVTGLAISIAAASGLVTVYSQWDAYGWWWLGLSLPMLLIVHDAYFYWTHRLLHHPRLFRLAHLLHHRSRSPSPFAAYAFAVPEALVETLFMPLVLLLVPLHALVIFVFLAIMIVRNVIAHCGYEIHPRGMADAWWGRWFTTTTHHDQHHLEGRYNYGLYFTWWDRLMGTENPRYRQRFREIVRIPAAAE